MAATGQSKTDKIARWKLLEARLRPQVAEQPHLAGAHAELQRLIAEAEALELQLQIHRAALRETAKKRNAVAKAGDALRFRFLGALNFALGPENSELMEYGLKPRRPAGGRPSKPEAGRNPAPKATSVASAAETPAGPPDGPGE